MDIAKLKIERVEGAIVFEELFGFADQMKKYAKVLQDALYDQVRVIKGDAKLEFAFRGNDNEPLLAVTCAEPNLLLQVTKDAMAFRFDDVYDYETLLSG